MKACGCGECTRRAAGRAAGGMAGKAAGEEEEEARKDRARKAAVTRKGAGLSAARRRR